MKKDYAADKALSQMGLLDDLRKEYHKKQVMENKLAVKTRHSYWDALKGHRKKGHKVFITDNSFHCFDCGATIRPDIPPIQDCLSIGAVK